MNATMNAANNYTFTLSGLPNPLYVNFPFQIDLRNFINTQTYTFRQSGNTNFIGFMIPPSVTSLSFDVASSCAFPIFAVSTSILIGL